jgi:4-alpha-glucanotransferase
MSSSALDAFMGLKGINPIFVDAWGNSTNVSENNIQNLITKMGYDGFDDSALNEHYIEKEKQHWLSPLSAIAVFQQSSEYIFDVCLR